MTLPPEDRDLIERVQALCCLRPQGCEVNDADECPAQQVRIALAAARAQAAPVVDEVRKVIECERDHWLKEAAKHRRPNDLRSDHAERDLERARIAERILGKFTALEAALTQPNGGQDD